MEAITIQLLHKFGDGSASDYRSYTGRDLTGEYYQKSEADAEFARLGTRIELRGDRVMILEDEIERLNVKIARLEADAGMSTHSCNKPDYHFKVKQLQAENAALREGLARLVSDKKELAEQSNLFRRQRNDALEALERIADSELTNHAHDDFVDVREIAANALKENL